MNIFRKGVLVTTLAASAVVASGSPANAQDYRYERDDTAASEIGAGLMGLAIVAIAASDAGDRYVDRRFYGRDHDYQGRDWDHSRYDDRRAVRNDDWIYRRNSGQSPHLDRRNRHGDDWRGGYPIRNDWRRGDRQRFDSRYYGRRGY